MTHSKKKTHYILNLFSRYFLKTAKTIPLTIKPFKKLLKIEFKFPIYQKYMYSAGVSHNLTLTLTHTFTMLTAIPTPSPVACSLSPALLLSLNAVTRLLVRSGAAPSLRHNRLPL